MYLAAGLGPLFRSSDAGLTFTALQGPAADQIGQAGVFSIGIAPSRGPCAPIFASASRGPLRSDDGGRTFTPIQRGYHGAPVNDLGIDAGGRLMVGVLSSKVVFRARKAGHADQYDGFGTNLTLFPTDQLPSADWSAAAVAPSTVDPGVAVVVTLGNGVYSTGDGGATWTRASIAPSFFNYFTRAAFAPGSATRVYVISSSFFRGGLYRSDNAGQSFARMSHERFGAVAVDPRNPDVILLASFDTGHGIFRTVDGGVTITPVGVPGNFSTLSIDPQWPQVIYAGNRGGGVLRSLDGGATWSSASAGLPSSEVLSVSADPRIVRRAYAWVKSAGLFVTSDSGETWTAADNGESARRTSIEFGRATMAVDPVKRGRVYLGNSGVVQVDTLGRSDDDD